MNNKIAKIAMKIATEYEYIYDPEHKSNPGAGFERTEQGWSNADKEEKKGLFDNETFQKFMKSPENRKTVKNVINSKGNKLKAALAALVVSVSAFAGTHDEAADFISLKEGTRMKNGYHVPYICPAGKKTIGYGETAPEIVERGKLTDKQAKALLQLRIKQHEKKILRYIKPKIWNKMHRKQKIALISLSYNMGSLAPCKKLRKNLNNGNLTGAVKEFADCNKVTVEDEYGNKHKVVSKGLDKRRKEEMKLWNEGYQEMLKNKHYPR